MILYLNKPLKADIVKMCGISLSKADHTITKFVKKGYVRRLDLGKYQFNLFFFSKGEWNDIENIKATFDYGTGEAVSEIVKKEENAMNIASDEIANKSFEELTELKKRAEQLNNIPLELWTKTDYYILNEQFADFIYEDCTPYCPELLENRSKFGLSLCIA